MRKHLLGVAATLALVLAAGCGGAAGSTSSGTACVNSSAAHKAYLVVRHADRKVVNKCVGFAAAQINGGDLMKQSGIEYQAQTFSFGKAVCQLDDEPAQFSECFPKDKPFWALYELVGGQPWVQAQTAYTQVDLKDGDALGWTYASPTASPAPPPLPAK